MACATCPSERARGSRFCGACGELLTRRRPPGAPGSIRDVFAAIRDERTGIAAAFTVLALCLTLSWFGWRWMALPAGWVLSVIEKIRGSAVPDMGCVQFQPGTGAMFVCSMKVAALRLAAPLTLVILMLALRWPIVRLIHAAALRLPAEARFVVAPLAATVLFGLFWAASHLDLLGMNGWVPQRLFPAFVGLFIWAGARYRQGLQRLFAPVYRFRDRVPRIGRLGVVFVLTVGTILLVTRQPAVTNAAHKEQATVLLALALGYLLLAPRDRPAPSRG